MKNPLKANNHQDKEIFQKVIQKEFLNLSRIK